MKHTPAPWEIIYDNGGRPIRKIGPVSSDQYAGESWLEVSSKDAQLIAAAPELLAALQAAVDCGMVPITSALEGGAAKYSIQVKVADQIRAAIAKATGNQCDQQ